MKLISNQKVEIIFRNNDTVVSGTIVSWLENNYVLKSLDGQSLIILNNPALDIMAIKVFSETEPIVQQPISSKEILEEVIDNSDLKHKKLAELYIESTKAEKQIIAEKLRNHHIGAVTLPKYATPNFFNKGK